jgi:hypothetical protein
MHNNNKEYRTQDGTRANKLKIKYSVSNLKRVLSLFVASQIETLPLVDHPSPWHHEG